MNIVDFITKWKKAELKERSAAQEHFLDLCRCLGHPTPADADPTGESFCFEKGASKQGGGEGFADVWKKDFFGWEYKGKHKDLDAAYNQLLLYRDALASPSLLVVCDLDRIIVHTNFTGTVGGPWDRYIDPATVTDLGAFKVGTVRYPRLVARDAECAARLKERTLTKLYNARHRRPRS